MKTTLRAVTAAMFGLGICLSVQAAEVTLKLGVATPTQHPHSISARKFAELVAEKSGGAIEIKVFDNASLGNNQELLDGVKTGAIHFTISTPSNMAAFSEGSGIALLELPFIFSDKAHMMKITRGEIGEKIAKAYAADTGIEVLGFMGGAQRNMITTKKQINSIRDLKGMKMRTWNAKEQLEWWKSLGALGTVVPFPEVYAALQTGVVDGAENEFSTFTSARWAEVARNIALTRHSITVRPLIGNAAKIAGLSANARAAIREAAREAAEFDVELEGRKDEENKAKLTSDYGVTFTNPDKAPMIEASSEAIKTYAREKGLSRLAAQIINAGG